MVETSQHSTVVEPSAAADAPAAAPRPRYGDEVVISGMSGIFPSSDSTKHFMENLYNKVDMVSGSQTRWQSSHPEMPQHLGMVRGMKNFDAQFFRVHYRQACVMEPMSRKLLEHAYSAIFDSGINPLELRGRKLGVFIGTTFSEFELQAFFENIQRNGFGITGCNRSMYANRISYWIDGKGPSYSLDVACSSSMACVEHAYRSISSGQCDAAIVGGCNLCMHPDISLHLRRAGFLCMDGKTKCFAAHGDGYVRADAISVLFLQRARDAKRIYAEVYHALGNYTHQLGANFLPIRDSEDIQKFLKEFYSGTDVSPDKVEYVEAHAAAIAEADTNELDAIGRVFGKEQAVKVGSVKSNMGNSEPASGVCALTKVCLAYHAGQLPANLHCEAAPAHEAAVRARRVHVLREHAPFARGFAALNSFSYSGSNVHVLLKGHYKPKDVERYTSSIPHLVLASGRQKSSVNTILDALERQPVDPELIALLHSIHESEIPGHMCRGYTLLETNENKETVSLRRETEFCSDAARPVWFVYSGMGSQWPAMGADLMKLSTFAAAIQRCHNVLEPKGIDIVRILTEPDKAVFDNILHSFVGIAAVQIGLTDLLRELDIVPDNIIGHSVGELGCAYADGCFTAEEMILSAYYRGLVSVRTPFIRGAMAAVGLGYKAILPLCPLGVEVACHNSSESSTISGPSDVMKTFVNELTSRGVFAKEVPCSNIAYHSKYIADAGPALLKYLSGVIINAKPRSPKWISTSVPQDKWNEPAAKFSSAEYHANNLLNPVLFEEASRAIPAQALLVEVAPHGLLQAILTRAHDSCAHVPLTRRAHTNPVNFLLQAVGRLYQEGLNPKVDRLYPKIEFPVATETPMLSHLVEWMHSEEWPESLPEMKDKVATISREFVTSLHEDDFERHMREEVMVFPEAAVLVLVWETLAMHKGEDYRRMSVKFCDVEFHEETSLSAEEVLHLDIMINKGNHKFEVSHDGVKIISGFVAQIDAAPCHPLCAADAATAGSVVLTASDVYKIMHQRGFSYKGHFQSIHSVDLERGVACVIWRDQWVTFLDSLFQVSILAHGHDAVSVPSLINILTIDTTQHQLTIQSATNDGGRLKTQLSKHLDVIRCGGVEMNRLVLADRARLDPAPDVLETGAFIPYFLTEDIDINTALRIVLQIIAENVGVNDINITEIITDSTSNISESIARVAADAAPARVAVRSPVRADGLQSAEAIRGSNVILVTNLLGDEKKKNDLHKLLPKNTFVLTWEDIASIIPSEQTLFDVVAAMSSTAQGRTLVLLRATDAVQRRDVAYLRVRGAPGSWAPRVCTLLRSTGRLVLVAEGEPHCGLLGFLKTLSVEYGDKVGAVVVDDELAPAFDPENNFYKEQLKKNLTVNILKKGEWGGHYYVPAEKLVDVSNVILTCPVPGDVDTLKWAELPSVPAGGNVVQVCYAGLSLQDIHKAVGLPTATEYGEITFGMDYSGIDSQGGRVMGVVAGGSVASVVCALPELTWPVPAHWSLEEAASVPLPFLLAYYCLAGLNPLLEEKAVFVTCGAGEVGQAVIAVSLALHCTVYTSISTRDEKKLLLKLFPELKEENIVSSHDDTFYRAVIQNSGGRGCAFVINTLRGPQREAAMKCVGSSGFLLDVDHFDMRENEPFNMSYLDRDRNYMAIILDKLFRPEHTTQVKRLQMLMCEGIARGVVRPIARVVLLAGAAPRAFRLLAAGRLPARVLIDMRRPAQHFAATPRMSCSPTGSYVVVCEEDEFSMELIERLVRRGARGVLVHLPAGGGGYAAPASGYCAAKLQSWRKQNVSIIISSENIETEQGCIDFLKKGSILGPVQAIFIVPGSTCENIERDDFPAKFNKIALVVANLDLVSRKICSELRHFVVATRAGFVAGGASDNYVASVCDKICQKRTEVDLPALALHMESLQELDLEEVEMQEQDCGEGGGSGRRALPVRAALHALESSLQLGYSDVRARNVYIKSSEGFLQKLSNILVVEKIDEFENHTLQDLCVNKASIEEIRFLLKQVYNVSYPAQKILRLTLASLKKLCDNMAQNTKFDSGLGAFYTFIEEDQYLATEPMIAMSTRLSTTPEDAEALDPKETYLILIPGFEGHHRIFARACKRIKMAAVTLQLGADVIGDSVKEMALHLLKFIKKRFVLKSKFYLLGYSFGVNVALELAAMLEREGLVGVVYCVDSSPDALRAQLAAYLGAHAQSDAALQDVVAEHMYRLISGAGAGTESDAAALRRRLRTLSSWQDKVDECVVRLRGTGTYSHQYKRAILHAAYHRIMLAMEYRPTMRLESELVLMKGIPHPDMAALAHDYGLSAYSARPVRVAALHADHARAPLDARVSNIINSTLEPRLLDHFNKKSLCNVNILTLRKKW